MRGNIQRKQEITVETKEIQNAITKGTLPAYMAALFSGLAICMGIRDGFSIPVPAVWVMLPSVVSAFLAFWILHLNEHRRLVMAIAVAGVLIYCGIFFSSVSNGLLGIINSVITSINDTMAQANIKYVVNEASLSSDMCTASIAVCLVVCFLFSMLFYMRRVMLCSLLLLAGSMINMIYKGQGSIYWVPLAIFDICLIFYLDNQYGWKKRLIDGGGMLWGVVFIFPAMLYILFVPFKTSSTVKNMKENLQYHAENILYGKSDYPEGQFKRFHLIDTDEKEEELRLLVEMDNAMPLHLKGYVGCQYTPEGWISNPENIYGGDYQGMLDWFREQDFYPLAQTGLYLQHSMENGFADAEIRNVNVHVKNLSARTKYQYVTENVDYYSMPELVSPKQDVNFMVQGLRGEKEYWYEAYSLANPIYEKFPSQAWFERNDEYKAFINAENVYRSFANAYYLDLPEEERALFKERAPECNNNVQSAVATVRKYLKDNIIYTEEVEEYRQGENFIRQILEDGRGDTPHFATVAVLLFRYYGIPARYVEGYYAKNDGMENEIGLTGKNAHAWVEIYVKGFGFVPVEVTPGFYEEEDNGGGSGFSASAGGGGGSEGSSYQEYYNLFAIDWKKALLIVLVILLAAVIGIAAFFAVRRHIVIKRRKRGLESENIYDVVETVSIYLRQLFEYDKEIPLEKQMPADIHDMLQQIRFSRHPLRREELRYVLAYMYQVSEDVWRGQSFIGKCKMMIACLR